MLPLCLFLLLIWTAVFVVIEDRKPLEKSFCVSHIFVMRFPFPSFLIIPSVCHIYFWSIEDRGTVFNGRSWNCLQEEISAVLLCFHLKLWLYCQLIFSCCSGCYHCVCLHGKRMTDQESLQCTVDFIVGACFCLFVLVCEVLGMKLLLLK